MKRERRVWGGPVRRKGGQMGCNNDNAVQEENKDRWKGEGLKLAGCARRIYV